MGWSAATGGWAGQRSSGVQEVGPLTPSLPPSSPHPAEPKTSTESWKGGNNTATGVNHLVLQQGLLHCPISPPFDCAFNSTCKRLFATLRLSHMSHMSIAKVKFAVLKKLLIFGEKYLTQSVRLLEGGVESLFGRILFEHALSLRGASLSVKHVLGVLE